MLVDPPASLFGGGGDWVVGGGCGEFVPLGGTLRINSSILVGVPVGLLISLDGLEGVVFSSDILLAFPDYSVLTSDHRMSLIPLLPPESLGGGGTGFGGGGTGFGGLFSELYLGGFRGDSCVLLWIVI